MKTSSSLVNDGASSHDPQHVSGILSEEESKFSLGMAASAANASSTGHLLGNACTGHCAVGSSPAEQQNNFFSTLSLTSTGHSYGHSETSTLGETTSLRTASHATCGSLSGPTQRCGCLAVQAYNNNNSDTMNSNNNNDANDNSPSIGVDTSAKPSWASSLSTRVPQTAGVPSSLPARLLVRSKDGSNGGARSEEQSFGGEMDFSSPGDEPTPPILCCTLEKNYSFQGIGGNPAESDAAVTVERTGVFTERPSQAAVGTPPQEEHSGAKFFSNSQLPSKNGSFFHKFLSPELLEPPLEHKHHAPFDGNATNNTTVESVARSDTTDSSKQCSSYYALYHLVNHHDHHGTSSTLAGEEQADREQQAHENRPADAAHAHDDATNPLSPNRKENAQGADFLKGGEVEVLRDFLQEDTAGTRPAHSIRSDTNSSLSSKVQPVIQKAVSCGSIASEHKRQEDLTLSQRKCTSLTTSQSLHSLVGTRTNASDCTTVDRSGCLLTRYGAIISSRMRDADDSGEVHRGSSASKANTLSMTTLQSHVDQVGTMEAEERIRRYEKPMIGRHVRRNKSAAALDEVLNQCDFLSLKDVVAAVKYTAPEEVSEAYAHVSNCQKSEGLDSSRMATSASQSHPEEHHHGSPQLDPSYVLDPQNAVSLAAAMTEVSLFRDSMGSSAPVLKTTSAESNAASKGGCSVNSTTTSAIRAMLTVPHHSCLSSTTASLEAASKASPTTNDSNQANGQGGCSASYVPPPLFDPLEHKVCDWTVSDKDAEGLLQQQQGREMELAPVQPGIWHALRTAAVGAGSQPGRTPPVCSCPATASPEGSLRVPLSNCHTLRVSSSVFSNGVSGEDMLKSVVIINDIHCSGFLNELNSVDVLQQWALVVYEADKLTSQTEVST